MMKAKVECSARLHGCYGNLPSNQILRLKWNKLGRFVDVCPKCFQEIKRIETKELKIPLQKLVGSGLYNKGVDSIDLKGLLEKWNKYQIDLL